MFPLFIICIQAFIHFATGCNRAPIGGLAEMKFKLQRVQLKQGHSRLPTAHTCFNLVQLPEYRTRAELVQQMEFALTECEGFGLQ